MNLSIQRKYKKAAYTIGVLSVDGKYFCETLEDTDRGLKQTDSLAKIKAVTVPGETAIPTGKYFVAMDVISPKYKAVKFYNDLCGGKVPRLLDVPGYSGCLIHTGNTQQDTEGCVLVGKNRAKGKVLDSRATFTALYKLMKAAADRKEIILLTIA